MKKTCNLHMKIGLDIMGGDYAPANCLDGAIMALDSLPSDVRMVLIGDSEKAKSHLKAKGIAEDEIIKEIQIRQEEKREITPIKNAEFKNLPDWVLQPSYSKGIAAVGEAKIGEAGLAFAKTEALANARNELARQIQVEVDNMFTSYTNVVGAGDNQLVEKVATDVSKQVASVSLKGSKQLNIWISEKNEIYVLVGVDNSVLNEQTKAAING